MCYAFRFTFLNIHMAECHIKLKEKKGEFMKITITARNFSAGNNAAVKYLISKGYKYAQLDSKSYAREKNRKKYIVRECEINPYGIFEGSYTWLDIDVFNASASFLPNTYKIGENDIIQIGYSSFWENLVEPIRA